MPFDSFRSRGVDVGSGGDGAGGSSSTDDETGRAIRPMLCTPGYTAKKFCRLPLGSESEMTPGDDTTNPFQSERERREVERVLQMREQRREREDREGDAFLETIPSERGQVTPGPLGDPPGFWNTPITHEIPEFEFGILDDVQAFDPFAEGDGF